MDEKSVPMNTAKLFCWMLGAYLRNWLCSVVCLDLMEILFSMRGDFL